MFWSNSVLYRTFRLEHSVAKHSSHEASKPTMDVLLLNVNEHTRDHLQMAWHRNTVENKMSSKLIKQEFNKQYSFKNKYYLSDFDYWYTIR